MLIQREPEFYFAQLGMLWGCLWSVINNILDFVAICGQKKYFLQNLMLWK